MDNSVKNLSQCLSLIYYTHINKWKQRQTRPWALQGRGRGKGGKRYVHIKDCYFRLPEWRAFIDLSRLGCGLWMRAEKMESTLKVGRSPPFFFFSPLLHCFLGACLNWLHWWIHSAIVGQKLHVGFVAEILWIFWVQALSEGYHSENPGEKRLLGHHGHRKRQVSVVIPLSPFSQIPHSGYFCFFPNPY